MTASELGEAIEYFMPKIGLSGFWDTGKVFNKNMPVLLSCASNVLKVLEMEEVKIGLKNPYAKNDSYYLNREKRMAFLEGYNQCLREVKEVLCD